MAGVVNIGGKDDAFYRYKMPQLMTKIEGRGNGIKTVVVNMSDVARALNRPPSYPTKYFATQLGALSSYDEKADKAVVNGAHEDFRLRELLNEFIKKYVLCAKCENPETLLHIDKKENISLECKACGHVTRVDPREKFNTFIIKNPPVLANQYANAEKLTAAVTADAEKAKKSIKESKSKKKREKEEESDDGVEWGEDTSAEATRKRREELGIGVKVEKMSLAEGSASQTQTPTSTTPVDPAAEAAAKLRTLVTGSQSETEIATEAKAIRASVKMTEATFVSTIFSALFSTNTVAQIQKKSPLLRKLLTDAKLVMAFLESIDNFFGAPENKAILKNVPALFNFLYEKDVVPEECFLKWSQKEATSEAATKVREAAVKFVEWLQNAEEESDEEED